MMNIKAREIFFNAVRFIPQHIVFTLYYFFLMAVSELLQVARTINMSTVTVGENQPQQVTDYSVIIKKMLPESFINLLQQLYMPYILFALTFLLLAIFMSVTFIIQALLRKRDVSLLSEVAHSFNALMRAPWAIVYFLALTAYMCLIPYLVTTQAVAAAATPSVFLPFFGVMLVFLVVGIALVYYQQLLYDNYYSLPAVLRTSWNYFTKSWFALLKLFIIIGILGLLLSAPFMFFGLSLAQSPLIMGTSFLLKTCISLLIIIGVNMIYLQVRSEK